MWSWLYGPLTLPDKSVGEGGVGLAPMTINVDDLHDIIDICQKARTREQDEPYTVKVLLNAEPFDSQKISTLSPYQLSLLRITANPPSEAREGYVSFVLGHRRNGSLQWPSWLVSERDELPRRIIDEVLTHARREIPTSRLIAGAFGIFAGLLISMWLVFCTTALPHWSLIVAGSLGIAATVWLVSRAVADLRSRAYRRDQIRVDVTSRAQLAADRKNRRADWRARWTTAIVIGPLGAAAGSALFWLLRIN